MSKPNFKVPVSEMETRQQMLVWFAVHRFGKGTLHVGKHDLSE